MLGDGLFLCCFEDWIFEMVSPVDASVVIADLHPGGSNMFENIDISWNHALYDVRSDASEMQQV